MIETKQHKDEYQLRKEVPGLNAMIDYVIAECTELDNEVEGMYPERLAIMLLNHLRQEWYLAMDELSECRSAQLNVYELQRQLEQKDALIADMNSYAIVPPEPKRLTPVCEVLPEYYKCTRCSRKQPLNEFAKDTHASKGHASVCKLCYQEDRMDKKEPNAEDPKRVLAARLTMATNETIRLLKAGGQLSDEWQKETALKHNLAPYQMRLVIDGAIAANGNEVTD